MNLFPDDEGDCLTSTFDTMQIFIITDNGGYIFKDKKCPKQVICHDPIGSCIDKTKTTRLPYI